MQHTTHKFSDLKEWPAINSHNVTGCWIVTLLLHLGSFHAASFSLRVDWSEMSNMTSQICWVVGAGLDSSSHGASSSRRLNCLSHLVYSGQHEMREKTEAERFVKLSLWNLHNFYHILWVRLSHKTRPNWRVKKQSSFYFWWEEL